MRVFVTGATGFIGRALVLRLRRDKHDVVAWVRSEDRARNALGNQVALAPSAGGDAGLRAALAGCDGVVNLAGEPIAGRWTRARKQRIRASRIDVTEQLASAIAALEPARRPRVLISGSALGYYGDRGDEPLGEDSDPGDGFLADLCLDWEAAARRAEAYARVVLARTGVVLGREGGLIAKLLPIARAGLAGRLGRGDQYLSWIHLHDHVEALVTALRDDRYRGPLNLTAPEPVTNRAFMDALARAAGQAALLPVPALVLRLVFGEASAALLGGQRALPEQLERLGFRFQHADLEGALADVLHTGNVAVQRIGRERAHGERPDAGARRARYVLVARQIVDQPPEEVFGFFSDARNLGPLTPPRMALESEPAAPEPLQRDDVIHQKVRVGPFALDWKAHIDELERPRGFVDSQQRGPFRAWRHEHRFLPEGRGTLVEDRVYYTPPLGLLGRLAHAIFIARSLRDVFGFRQDAIRLRFGSSLPAPAPAPR